MTQYYYNPIPVNAISASLTAAFEGMEKDGGKFMRAANINSVIVTHKGADQDQLEELIYNLSLVHPNRCFVIVLDDGASGLEASFSARCHAVSSKEHVCSEVVRLQASPNNLSAVGNVLRANLLIGKASELVLLDSKVAKIGVEAFSPICDQTIFSSAMFADDLSFADTLVHSGLGAVDLEWVKLGIWRDQVKDVFESAVWRNFLPSLQSLEIETVGGPSSQKSLPTCGLLLAGWFAGQLGLRIGRIQNNVISCSGTGYNEIKVALQRGKDTPTKEGELGELSRLTLKFGDGANDGSVVIQRRDDLEVSISLAGSFRLLRSFDDESQSGLLKRYFLIGEATINYNRSLKNALRIFNGLRENS